MLPPSVLNSGSGKSRSASANGVPTSAPTNDDVGTNRVFNTSNNNYVNNTNNSNNASNNSDRGSGSGNVSHHTSKSSHNNVGEKKKDSSLTTKIQINPTVHKNINNGKSVVDARTDRGQENAASSVTNLATASDSDAAADAASVPSATAASVSASTGAFAVNIIGTNTTAAAAATTTTPGNHAFDSNYASISTFASVPSSNSAFVFANGNARSVTNPDNFGSLANASSSSSLPPSLSTATSLPEQSLALRRVGSPGLVVLIHCTYVDSQEQRLRWIESARSLDGIVSEAATWADRKLAILFSGYIAADVWNWNSAIALLSAQTAAATCAILQFTHNDGKSEYCNAGLAWLKAPAALGTCLPNLDEFRTTVFGVKAVLEPLARVAVASDHSASSTSSTSFSTTPMPPLVPHSRENIAFAIVDSDIVFPRNHVGRCATITEACAILGSPLEGGRWEGRRVGVVSPLQLGDVRQGRNQTGCADVSVARGRRVTYDADTAACTGGGCVVIRGDAMPIFGMPTTAARETYQQEDLLLAHEVRLAGWAVVIVGTASVIHPPETDRDYMAWKRQQLSTLIPRVHAIMGLGDAPLSIRVDNALQLARPPILHAALSANKAGVSESDVASVASASSSSRSKPAPSTSASTASTSSTSTMANKAKMATILTTKRPGSVAEMTRSEQPSCASTATSTTNLKTRSRSLSSSSSALSRLPPSWSSLAATLKNNESDGGHPSNPLFAPPQLTDQRKHIGHSSSSRDHTSGRRSVSGWRSSTTSSNGSSGNNNVGGIGIGDVNDNNYNDNDSKIKHGGKTATKHHSGYENSITEQGYPRNVGSYAAERGLTRRYSVTNNHTESVRTDRRNREHGHERSRKRDLYDDKHYEKSVSSQQRRPTSADHQRDRSYQEYDRAHYRGYNRVHGNVAENSYTSNDIQYGYRSNDDNGGSVGNGDDNGDGDSDDDDRDVNGNNYINKSINHGRATNANKSAFRQHYHVSRPLSSHLAQDRDDGVDSNDPSRYHDHQPNNKIRQHQSRGQHNSHLQDHSYERDQNYVQATERYPEHHCSHGATQTRDKRRNSLTHDNPVVRFDQRDAGNYRDRRLSTENMMDKFANNDIGGRQEHKNRHHRNSDGYGDGNEDGKNEQHNPHHPRRHQGQEFGHGEQADHAGHERDRNHGSHQDRNKTRAHRRYEDGNDNDDDDNDNNRKNASNRRFGPNYHESSAADRDNVTDNDDQLTDIESISAIDVAWVKRPM